MIILGIDPGLAETGWAILEGEMQGAKLIELIKYGCLKTKKGTDFSQRLLELSRQVKELTDEFHPTELAIEELFFAANAKTAIKVAQCLGAIKLTAQESGLAVFEYTPLNVKMTIAGYGRAEKIQIQKMVGALLKIKQKITPDHAADAVAVGLTHLYTNKKLT